MAFALFASGILVPLYAGAAAVAAAARLGAGAVPQGANVRLAIADNCDWQEPDRPDHGVCDLGSSHAL